jgi:hypothetical protein
MGYMIFGFAVIFGSIALYLGSLVNRWRNLVKDEELMQDLDEE